MRFCSQKVDGIQIYAVTGINTVSFAIDATAQARKGLLGFTVERYDPTEDHRVHVRGYKVFRSIVPNPDEKLEVSTFIHPVQSFVWDDMTAKPGRRYVYAFQPFRGKPKQPVRGTPVTIEIDTEELFSTTDPHDVFFNRGVASSQAYAKRFENLPPDKQPTPEKRAEAWQWLARDLRRGILKFIDDTRPGDTLLGCFYELRYRPVVDALMAAIGRGVDVRLVIDAKDNAYTDKNGKYHPAFPRVENRALLAAAQFPASRVIERTARTSSIQHNKFMVVLAGGQQPSTVWTGSTNISVGGFYGQTNVGHWIRDPNVARAYHEYWKLLATDPGGRAGDDDATVRKRNKELRAQVEAIVPSPTSASAIPKGITPIFSPRAAKTALELYAELVDSAKQLSCITLAFGVNAAFKTLLSDNTPVNALTLMLLEKEDKPKKNAAAPFVVINARNNVYKAWGAHLSDPFHQWVRETSTSALRLNQHVMYVHSKFLLHDPLGADPIVVTGSANFSDDSTKENDENMVIIRGNQRVADIYFTEFNRLFNHYYFRAVYEKLRAGDQDPTASVFLAEDDGWLAKYAPGTYRTKRIDAYRAMSLS